MSRAFELLVRLRSYSARRSAWLQIALAPGCEERMSQPETSVSQSRHPRMKFILPMRTIQSRIRFEQSSASYSD